MDTNIINQPVEKYKPKDVYQMVTDTIIEQLETGVIPWQQPYKVENTMPLTLPGNAVTNNKYRGINILLLWSSAIKYSFTTNEWATFKQWEQKGEFPQKGAKGNLVVYYDTFEKEVDGEKQNIPFLKSSYVFNRCQLKSFQEEPFVEHETVLSLPEKIDPIETFIANTKAVIEHYKKVPCYNLKTDKIMMPHPEYFQTTATCTATEGYYSTILHEMIHWSGAEKRLERTKGKQFGDDQYAVEELVAEFGAAFLCAGFGINTVEKGDHASYIDFWLKVLKEDKQYIVRAASAASKAVDYLNGLQPE